MKAGVFEAMVDDLRELLRLLDGRKAQPSAVILDSRTLQSTAREWQPLQAMTVANAGMGSKVHVAVDTLGHLERPAYYPCQ